MKLLVVILVLILYLAQSYVQLSLQVRPVLVYHKEEIRRTDLYDRDCGFRSSVHIHCHKCIVCSAELCERILCLAVLFDDLNLNIMHLSPFFQKCILYGALGHADSLSVQ